MNAVKNGTFDLGFEGRVGVRPTQMWRGTLQTGQGWGEVEAGGGNGLSKCTGILKPK